MHHCTSVVKKHTPSLRPAFYTTAISMVDSVKKPAPAGYAGFGRACIRDLYWYINFRSGSRNRTRIHSIPAPAVARKTQLLARLLQKLAWKFKKTCIKLTIFLALR